MSILGGDLPDVWVAGRRLAGPELRAAGAVVADRVQARAMVAVDASATLETVVGVVGCLLAGVPFVPVPPDAGTRERAHLLSDSGAELWLGGPREDLAVPVVPVDVTARGGADWSEPVDGTAMVLYTSGTTGAPKGAVISRRAVVACLDGLREAWAWTPADVLVHGLPLFHVHGLVLGLLGALRIGSPLRHTGRATPTGYAAAADEGGTLFFGVPTVWGRVAAEPSAARALRTARLLVSGSAGLPPTVFQALRQHCGQGPAERYGMTETLITVATRADEERRPGWVGTPISGVQTRLVDEAGQPVADGEIGHLQVRGATVFDGYLHRNGPPLTADGWFVTGDAAVIDPEGRHRIIGRAKDDLIKSGGYRVGAGEIESVLLAHPLIAEVAVVGEPDPDLGQRIVAYVVGGQVEDTELIQWVVAELSVHKRPREIRFVAELPRNAMGKVQKSRLS